MVSMIHLHSESSIAFLGQCFLIDAGPDCEILTLAILFVQPAMGHSGSLVKYYVHAALSSLVRCYHKCQPVCGPEN